MCQFKGPVTVHAYSLTWLTGILKWNRAINNSIRNTYAYPAITNQNVCCEGGLCGCSLMEQQIPSLHLVRYRLVVVDYRKNNVHKNFNTMRTVCKAVILANVHGVPGHLPSACWERLHPAATLSRMRKCRRWTDGWVHRTRPANDPHKHV